MKKVAVISLGGSLIVPNKIDIQFLDEFKEVLLKNVKNYKFIVVCGGGNIARTYIKALEGKENFQGFLGIAVTRINARFMTYFFGRDANKGIPHDMKDIKNILMKNEIEHIEIKNRISKIEDSLLLVDKNYNNLLERIEESIKTNNTILVKIAGIERDLDWIKNLKKPVLIGGSTGLLTYFLYGFLKLYIGR